MQAECYDIETPENIVFGYELSGLGSRFLAAMFDSLILAILLIITYMASIAFLLTPLGETFSGALGDWIVALYFLLTFAFTWGYYIWFEIIWNGQTPGKRWLGLRVLRTDGLPITLVESVVRNLVRIVDFLPLYYGLGVVVMIFNPQSRRLGDLAAGTLVVKERKDMTLLALSRVTAPVKVQHAELLAAWGDATGWPVERLARDDFHLAREFLARRARLINRDQLAIDLAAKWAGQLELLSPTTPPACEAFLEQLVALDSEAGAAHSPLSG